MKIYGPKNSSRILFFKSAKISAICGLILFFAAFARHKVGKAEIENKMGYLREPLRSRRLCVRFFKPQMNTDIRLDEWIDGLLDKWAAQQSINPIIYSSIPYLCFICENLWPEKFFADFIF